MNLHKNQITAAISHDYTLQLDHTIFKDVHAHSDIYALYKRGIVTGYEDHTFQPHEPIVKHQVAAMISRAFSFPTTTKFERLYDVPARHTNYAAIHYLHIANVFSSPCRLFFPHATLTYVEATNILSQVVFKLLGPSFVEHLQFPVTVHSKAIVSRLQFAMLLQTTLHFVEQSHAHMKQQYRAV